MSAEAQVRLSHLWEKLVISKVKRTIAREPEDVIRMELMPSDPERTGRVGRVHRGEVISSNRSSDVPEGDRWRLQITWRHFYGFTTDNVYFGQQQHNTFDYGLGLCPELNHEDGWLDQSGIYSYRPRIGDYIAGELEVGPRGRRFGRWFRCSEYFGLMVELIRKGERVPTRELARKLYVNSGGYGDTYWVFANLLLNDDISPFISAIMEKEDRPPHPAAGMPSYFGRPVPEDWPIGLGQSCATWLHELSVKLKAPWWSNFVEEAERLGLEHFHPQFGAICEGCDIEQGNWTECDPEGGGFLLHTYPYQG